jgi:2-methylisocitrate lyase-like PEP mutase family enzyme
MRGKADALRALHVPGRPLVLLNAWDAGSAAVIARAGAPAVATTSAGAANALGYPDGQILRREQMLSMVAPIARAVDVPVTADMEAGYGDGPEDAAATARGVIEAGAVGLNLEDTAAAGDDPLLPIPAFVAKIEAVRAVSAEAGVPLVLNARTDVFIGEVDDPATRLERAIERGRAYLAAGADCIFVPAVVDDGVIAALVEGIGGPVSVLAGAGSPSVAELATLGVARVSVGSGAYRAALALARSMAEEAYDSGSFGTMLASQVSFDETQTLFEREQRREARHEGET